MRLPMGTFALLVAVHGLGGCSREAAAPSASEERVVVPEGERAVRAEPPVQDFQAPKPWVPTWGDDKTPVEPPDMHAETWRVFVEQSEPLQTKTPHWQKLPADQAVEVQMPEGSRFRCLAQPVTVAPSTNDFGSSLKGWIMSRDVYCSADDWASWQIYPQRDFLAANGERESKLLTQANLRERKAAGKVYETVVITRSDEEKRAATVGPPRILAGVVVDDD